MYKSILKLSIVSFTSLLTLSALTLIPSLVSAQNLKEGVTESCPLYNVRNITVSVAPASSGISLGTKAIFDVKVFNTNSFPVIDGSLFVKIVSADGRIADRFFADTKSININAGESSQGQFAWKVPAFALPGLYSAQVYFVTSNQFYLGGVGFIDGFPAGETVFSVNGENKSYVSLDEASLVINKQAYSSRSIPTVSSTEPVNVSVKVKNNLKEKTQALVTWKIYKWDDAREGNLLSSSIQKVDILPGVVTDAKLVVNDVSYSSYRVVAEINWMDTKSIATNRFVRKGVSDSAINFLAFSALPVSKASAQVIGCIDNALVAGDDKNFPKILTIKATDESNNPVFTQSYDVSRFPIAGFAKSIPQGNYSKLNIVAELSTKGSKSNESAHITYIKSSEESSSNSFGSVAYIYMTALLAGLIGTLFSIKLHRRLSKKDDSLTNN